jgi:hypothetical protein
MALSAPISAAPLSAKQLKSIEELEIAKEPTTRDWRAFHKAEPSFRSALWSYHKKRQVGFPAWSWGWRMGWVRACAANPTGYCEHILETALFDKALVVRSEAATQVGRIFESTKNEKFSALLIKAYNNPKNYRNKKPLFVQQRILFALHQIGNKEAAVTGKKMSAGNPDLAVYWSRITKF